MTAFPWYNLTKPERDGGVYELRHYTVHPGKVDTLFLFAEIVL